MTAQEALRCALAAVREGVQVKFDWYDELDRLRAIADRMGVAA